MYTGTCVAAYEELRRAPEHAEAWQWHRLLQEATGADTGLITHVLTQNPPPGRDDVLAAAEEYARLLRPEGGLAREVHDARWEEMRAALRRAAGQEDAENETVDEAAAREASYLEVELDTWTIVGLGPDDPAPKRTLGRGVAPRDDEAEHETHTAEAGEQEPEYLEVDVHQSQWTDRWYDPGGTRTEEREPAPGAERTQQEERQHNVAQAAAPAPRWESIEAPTSTAGAGDARSKGDLQHVLIPLGLLALVLLGIFMIGLNIAAA